MSEILLSVVVAIGRRRDRARRLLDALCSQSCIEALELVVVDLAPEGMPEVSTAPGIRTLYVRYSEGTPLSDARVAGLRLASAPVVAFLEDHCYPTPGWAEAVIAVHGGPWVAVGYAITNANPESYVSRAGLMSDYGLWMHPVKSGQRRLLTGSNVAYKRDLLLSFGEELAPLLAISFNLHQIFNRRGLPMYVESRALVAHENFTDLVGLLHSNHVLCRLLALGRVRSESWGVPRRLAYGLAVPPGAPALKLARLVYSLRDRPSLWRDFILALPLIVPVYLWSAIGESLGYLLPHGSTDEEYKWWEIEAERAPAV
ncbi:MAG TPA: glycosyltransferase [Ardenticatenaceae bacterium]|nr:glycosyltransferase [Ardenticatenaceae bacterium]